MERGRIGPAHRGWGEDEARRSTTGPGRSRWGLGGLTLAVLVGVGPSAVVAQDPPGQARGEALRVYLDCSAGRSVCSESMYRQEITFVNWVREPQDAQVHVILTSQDVGGGGNRYTLDFLGREDLAGLEDRLTYTSSSTDVEDEILDGLIRTLSLGLVRYAAAAGLGDGVRVEGAARGGQPAAPAGARDDPWNFWVFDIDADFSIELEDLQESRELGFGVTANRTTEAWKLNVRANGEFEREQFELPDEDRTIRNDQDQWEVSAFAVKSMNEHMGVGAELTANNSTQLNRDLLVGIATGVEYNYFPYSQSNRRVLLGRYVVSLESVQYQDTTVFDALDETVYRHELSLQYDAREPWGNARIGSGVSQYLDRTSAWSFNVDGFVSYRIFRGLSVTVNGEYRRVKDQIYLSKAGLDEEDILLGRRRLPTASQTELRLGLSYSFGSIFNNAVNERFSRGLF